MKKGLKKQKNRKNKNFKSTTSGITLIALVITIIVLLILAGVSIATLTGNNGILTQAAAAKEATENARKDELAQLGDLEDYINGVVVSEEGFDTSLQVNKPKLKTAMIPVYYENGVWKKADSNNENKQWYDYDNKKWANIVTVSDNDAYLREAEVGTEIPTEKITTFFVWIPRYAYSITSGYKQGNGATGSIDITFLKGNTNIGVDGITYATDYDESTIAAGGTTPKIVHPGFTLGNSQISGIWVAKFEASGTNKDGNEVGNGSASSSAQLYAPDSSTYVRILPSKVSWRYLTIGESEYQSMKMSANKSSYGWNNTVNSHLIKNSEWGAVAYLCYSKYGSIPKTNGSGSLVSNSHWYDMYTGAGPKATNDEGWYNNFTEDTHGYSTVNGQLSSTTGNIYGIYDMAGGNWERVAAYLDNGNGNLNYYGKSSTDGNIKYFENGKLNSAYEPYWDKYEVSDEEKNNQIAIEGESPISQGTLWNWNKREEKYHTARLRITQETFTKMAKNKGIGVNEVAKDFSFYAPYTPGTENNTQPWGWFKTAEQATAGTQSLATTWNNDYVLIGHASSPFVVRGGHCSDGTGAGVLYSDVTNGYTGNSYGFRPALAF